MGIGLPNPFERKNEIWKYKYQNYEIMITMKRAKAKASHVALYINGEKVNESLFRLHTWLEGTLPTGQTVFVRMESGMDNINCDVVVGRKPHLERHGKNISDNEVETFAAMGMLSGEFSGLSEK